MTDNHMICVIAESSAIVSEGVKIILERSGICSKIITVFSPDELEQAVQRNPVKLVVANPSIILQKKDFAVTLKEDSPDLILIGLIYTYFDPKLLSVFDSLLDIHLQPGEIVEQIQKLVTQKAGAEGQQGQVLSERELEVLTLLVTGYSNKEIAEKLFISVHTVISHRKNITHKTGIKSVSGLTIYAVVKNLVKLDEFS